MGFLGGSDGKENVCNAEDLGLFPGSGRCPGEGNGNPVHYSCLENSMNREAWWAKVHGVTKSWRWLSDSLLHPNCILSLVAQLHPTFCSPMDCSIPGFPVHHQLPELAQTHVHGVGDAIQPSHPRLSPSFPAFTLSWPQSLFNESVLHIRWPKSWSFSFSFSPFNEYSELISFRID